MSDPPAPPQVSPDGKSYWDGQRWVPMQSETPLQPPWQPPSVVVVKQPRAKWIGWVGYGLLAVAAVGVFAAVTALWLAAGD
jgi:hypothetical protein